MPSQSDKMPRIMHVVSTMGAGGGAEQLVYNMVRDHSGSGNPPVVCCLHFVGSLGEKLRSEGVPVYFRCCLNGLKPGIVPWLSRIMKDEKVDVVHAHTYTPLFYAVPAALLAGGLKVVYTEHGRLYPDGRRWKRYLLNPFLAMGAEHIVSISARTKVAMIRYDNYPAAKIRIIHNGVDCTTFRPASESEKAAGRRALGLEANCRVVGTAVRLEDIKNISMMLRVFRQVLEKMPDTHLLIAGSGTKEAELKAMAEEFGMASRVVFLGLRYDMPEIYRLFDVFVLTSFTEGIAVTLLEAMATGIPAVVTNVGGNPEVVVEGETGYLVPLDDDNEMTARLLELLKDPGLTGSMGAKGRERVLAEFSFEGMIGEYRTLYQAGNQV